MVLCSKSLLKTRHLLYILLAWGLITSGYILVNLFSRNPTVRHPIRFRNASNIYGAAGCPVNGYRERLKTLLGRWEVIAVRRNITQYFLCFGSMLGSFRDGNVVPHDHDVDVCMFRRDLYKLEAEDEKRPFKYNDGKLHMILQRRCHHPKNETRQDCQGKFVNDYVDACSILDPCGRILLGSPPFLDVFAFKDNGEQLLDEYKSNNYKRDVILPVKPCQLMGVWTKCVNNPTVYLKRNYGAHFLNETHVVCKDGKWAWRVNT